MSEMHNLQERLDLSEARKVKQHMAELGLYQVQALRVLAWFFAGFGIVMGLAGLMGLSFHPGALTSLLS